MENVLSDEGHTSEFLCAICQQLVEYPLSTACSHIFCESCLGEWFKRRVSCPTCKTDLNRAVGAPATELKKANPLAHRILLRIKIRCPLHSQGCAWRGDYSELHSHLTNSTEHMSEGADAALANAEAMKEQVGDPLTHSFPPSHSSTPARGDP